MGHKQKRVQTDRRQPRASTEAMTREPALELRLEEEDGDTIRRHGLKPKLKGGYDPYDQDPLKKKKIEVVRQSPDLRKLSEWIRLKREVEELKQQGDADTKK
jgi:hypothetical protein